MSNMAYCRFQNTATDLYDCLNHFDDDLSADEKRARQWIIEMCQEIIDMIGDDDDDDDE